MELFFNKILLQEEETDNLIDITDLDEERYEEFLEFMQHLQSAYIVAKKGDEKDTRTKKN